MDAAWAAVLAGFVGTLVGGAATYLGPMRAQKRAIEASAADREAARRDEAVRCVALVRSEAQAWLTYLLRTLTDVSDARYPRVSDFDEKAGELRRGLEKPLAELLTYNLDVFYSGHVRNLRDLDQQVRDIVVAKARFRAAALLGLTNSLDAFFTPRAIITTLWADDARNGRCRDDNPLRGTVFDPRQP